MDDFAAASLLALEKLDHYSVLNIGLGKGYSVKQVLQTILEIVGRKDAKVVFNPDKPTMIPVRLVDTSKAEKLLGFRAQIDLREGLEKTIHWYTSAKKRNLRQSESRVH